jgi:hypothetical protein
MAYKVIILAIPGIGTHDKGFSEDLESDIKRFSKGTDLENSYKIVEALPFKFTRVDDNQEKLHVKNKLGGNLSLREFVIKAFGDAVTFEHGAEKPNSVYKKIHTYLRETIVKVNDLKVQNTGARIVIVAASMGVHLISTYIWDADNSIGIFETQNATERENLRNLDYMFSIGCNIPLFISGKEITKLKPIEKRNSTFKWDNYYDRDDVLGWPLSDINDEFKALVNDFEINTGQYIGSHLKYWKDNDFTKPFVENLIAISNM